jgi:hypothetical protein
MSRARTSGVGAERADDRTAGVLASVADRQPTSSTALQQAPTTHRKLDEARIEAG